MRFSRTVGPLNFRKAKFNCKDFLMTIDLTLSKIVLPDLNDLTEVAMQAVPKFS